VCDTDTRLFSRGAALNAGIRGCDADVIVAHDGDMLPPPDSLTEAIAAAADADGMVQPFDRLHYATQAATRSLWAADVVPAKVDTEFEFSPSSTVPLLGGVNVLSRSTWERAGGWLDRFAGWGCEDMAFAAQCSTLVAPVRRVAGGMVHLWHPKTGDYVSKSTLAANRAHMRRVLAADGDPEAMQAMIEGHDVQPTRYVILAAGEGTRWGDAQDRPKHFAVLLGEPLIGRVVRQVLERDPGADVRVAVRSLADARYKIPGTKRTVAKLNPELGNADKLVSTRHAWSKSGRTVILLGDVFYTEEAMDRIVAHPADEWVLFGRPGGSKHSGKRWNENFALAYMPQHHDLIVDAAHRVVALHAAGRVGRLSHSTWFRAAVGLPDGEVGTWDVHPERFGHFEVVDDWTDDIDSPEDWERWCYAWATAPTDRRPS